ncbi:snRNA-activating protein complex subunit 1b [Cololabis saira]|uniref:snRNA-activating protein complex subunit 1b n=1 Tax=Cololabis saira TaxID=129043 RepID=UPI002AD370BB|nr:snRNA-activating protein complex subunit 1b [Cololabis saira]
MEQYRKQVKADCEELLIRFQQTRSVRFEVFSEIWRQMKFAQIFYGATNHRKRPFSRLVLETAYCYVLPPFSFQIRVGGLYLLYSLYQSQNLTPPEQIRLALKDWDDVQRFEKDARDAQHLDTVYILHRLVSCKAFHFSAMPSLLLYRKKRNPDRSLLCEELLERACRPQELINTEVLEEMSNVHELYAKMKASVASASASPASGDLIRTDLIRTDLAARLRGSVLDFYTWQQDKDKVDADEDGDEGTSSQQQCSRRAELLASIKSRAFGEASEACKSRRHRQVELDWAVGESSRPARPRTIKPSLKNRTSQNLHLSGDAWKDVGTTTLISCLSTLDAPPQEKKEKWKKMKWC